MEEHWLTTRHIQNGTMTVPQTALDVQLETVPAIGMWPVLYERPGGRATPVSTAHYLLYSSSLYGGEGF